MAFTNREERPGLSSGPRSLGRALVLNERAADRREVVACRLAIDRPLDHPITSQLMAAVRTTIGYRLA